MSRYLLCCVGGVGLVAVAVVAVGPLGFALAVPAALLAALALKLQGDASRARYDAMHQDFGRLQRDYLTLKQAVEGSRQQVVQVSSLMNGLAALASVTSQSRELPRIFGSLLELLQRQVGARRASLWLVDQETGALKLQAGVGWTDEQRAGTILGRNRSANGTELPPVMSAPLVNDKEVLGALNVEEVDPGRRPSEAEAAEDARLLQFLAALAAMAVRTARAAAGAPDPVTTDKLTRVFTHRYFQDALDAELRRADRYGDFLSLILVDLDHFAAFNDAHGQQAGDLALRETAAVMKQSVREMDLVARYGGGQLVAVLPQTNKAGAIALAERLRAAVERRDIGTETGAVRVTISLGVATFPADAKDKAQLVTMVDRALGEAKKAGRNRVRFASSPGDGLPPSASSAAAA